MPSHHPAKQIGETKNKNVLKSIGLKEERVMSGNEEFSNLAPIQKCPICGRDLCKGYIILGGGIFWDKKKHKWDVDTSKLLFPYSFLLRWSIPNLPALRCKKCKLLIFNYVREPKE